MPVNVVSGVRILCCGWIRRPSSVMYSPRLTVLLPSSVPY